MEHINWYPGHMKKTRELIQENLKLVDVCVEVLDARIPVSSRNPILAELTQSKTRIIVLNKSDLADEAKTAEWTKKLQESAAYVLAMNCSTGAGAASLLRLLEKIRDEKNEGRERQRDLRLMIVGIPNVGKSSLINRLTGKKAAKTGNKPGVTRGKQWISLGEHMMMLDTPGILWPKFEDPKVGLNLAFCGSIKDEIMDLETLGMELTGVLARDYPDLLSARYKLDEIAETPLENMENVARKRGFILPGKRIDYERTARTVIDEFRAGTIGRITLE
ncbi:MAG: ribosome biogenesis GTPase YlqF [Firmicutes bacterium]|nr:ribosome biogenesis GTPase YlqF [Bacillota bacterium]MBR0210625.1 ribosome biogenesis GTPase YlqF [Bacillota bacterium]